MLFTSRNWPQNSWVGSLETYGNIGGFIWNPGKCSGTFSMGVSVCTLGKWS